ncbi:exo-beta-N-acetylmuramidase NamZ family protein [Flavisolibacter nicotianae]|uniref:exo-beta-N-acetylmuramidase NamZ family protein n=1 Tax=Flavisolibacter nicotianae TaxID=2364882 RepID=UPI000EAF1F8E|nr:DUF1343 domain-containing protein [Flavisolibacter nicotianae]
MLSRLFLFLLAALSVQSQCSAQKQKIRISENKIKVKTKGSASLPQTAIIPAADQMNKYLPLLKGKNVALLVNQTSVVGNTHLIDTLLHAGVKIKVVFGPEHGFRGDAPDGAKIETTTDPKTGVPVVSLYGKKNKPTPEDLRDVDIMVYDIQDVGTRFYTYISSMQYFLEAALENGIPFVILDRPNPNGFYVDGPVLDTKFKSFVGLQPIPVVYGMTIGEYAHMLLEEGWLNEAANKAYEKLKLIRFREGAKYFHLQVIPVANYTHKSKYMLPVKPSPNLPEMQSIYWYPSTCFFEGTTFSEGRGTPKPFQYIGHPLMPKTMFSFMPASTTGAPEPKHKGKTCYGYDLSGTPEQVLQKVGNRLQLKYLLEAYRLFPDKENFFTKNNGINRLAGTDELMQQIKEGKSEDEIRQSWEPKLGAFKVIRKKYLLYPDFD